MYLAIQDDGRSISLAERPSGAPQQALRGSLSFFYAIMSLDKRLHNRAHGWEYWSLLGEN